MLIIEVDGLEAGLDARGRARSPRSSQTNGGPRGRRLANTRRAEYGCCCGSAASRRSARSAGSPRATARRTASCRGPSCRTSCGSSREIGEQYDIRIANVFHAGDGNIHPILLFDERDADQVKRVLAASHEILDECIAVGGSVTGEHGIGVEKIDFMPKLFTPGRPGRDGRGCATAFNPEGRCSPAKMLPGGAAASSGRAPGTAPRRDDGRLTVAKRNKYSRWRRLPAGLSRTSRRQFPDDHDEPRPLTLSSPAPRSTRRRSRPGARAPRRSRNIARGCSGASWTSSGSASRSPRSRRVGAPSKGSRRSPTTRNTSPSGTPRPRARPRRTASPPPELPHPETDLEAESPTPDASEVEEPPGGRVRPRSAVRSPSRRGRPRTQPPDVPSAALDRVESEPEPSLDSTAPRRPSAEEFSASAEIVLRHAGRVDAEGATFLNSLRRGETLDLAAVAELARALRDLEAEYGDATAVDRRLAFALHRLAFEGQVLLTDSWPGAFDTWTDRRAPRGPGVGRSHPLGPRHPLLRHRFATGETSIELARLPERRPAGRRPPRLGHRPPRVRRRAAPGRGGPGRARLRDLPARGGGPPSTTAACRARPGVAIDTRALNEVIDYPAADMTITVQAGITLASLRAVLAEQGQRLAVDAPHPDRATLGGIFATNTSGPRRFGAGRPRDQIIGVSFVTADGTPVKGGGRVVKNVAGYDFPKLLTGSLGTLGILTQMTLKVRPAPEASAIAWASFPDADRLGDALDRLNTSADPPDRPGAPEPLGGAARGRRARPADRGLGARRRLRGQRRVGRLAARSPGGRAGRPPHRGHPGGARPSPLWSALTEFQAAEVGPVGFVASLRPSSVVPFVRGLDPSRWAVQAHAGNGIVRGHALGADEELEALAPEIDRLRSEAGRDGGSLILPRCPTAWKERLRVWGDPRPDWGLAERVKRALDPKGVMNPGRFVGTI